MNARFAVLAVLAAGCGSHPQSVDPAAFRAAAERLLSSVERHRTGAATAGAPDACRAQFDLYLAEARPTLEELTAMGGAMDTCMRSRGHGTMADIVGTCASLRQELDAHAATGCGADPSRNQAEIERHCAAMSELALRTDDRAQMMMTGGGMDCH